jgi:hypothetical protein
MPLNPQTNATTMFDQAPMRQYQQSQPQPQPQLQPQSQPQLQPQPAALEQRVRIFNSQLVNEVKGKATDMPFEKSRLVVQAHNDEGKEMILTQSLTIQRASQQAPSLAKNSDKKIRLSISDITQVYIQSITFLNRLILARLPNTIMIVRKLLYGIPEPGTHWWATYHKHRKKKKKIFAMVTPNPRTPGTGTVYREQHARGAYITTICQPEAAFDLSVTESHRGGE